MRYRHLRRTTIATLAAVALVLILGVAASQLLGLPAVRKRAAAWLCRRLGAATGAEVAVDELRWGLFPPRVDLTGLKVRGPAVDLTAGEVTVTGAGLHISRRSLALGAVTARHVRVRVRFDRMPKRGERSAGRRLRVVIRQLNLNDVSFQGTGLPGHLDLGLEGLRTEWTLQEGFPRGVLVVRQAVLRLASLKGREPLRLAVRARFRLNDGVHLPHLEIRGRGVSLAGSASYEGKELFVEGRGRLDLAALDELVIGERLLRGELAYSLRLQSKEKTWLAVDLRAPGVTLLGFTVRNVEGQLALQKDRLVGLLRRGTLFGGRFSGRYELRHLGPPYPHAVTLRGEGASLAALLRWLKVPDTGVTATAGVEAELRWKGRHVKAGEGTATVDLSPAPGGLPARGRMQLGLARDGLIRFDGEDLQLGQSRVTWQGPLTMGSWEPAWSITADPARISEVAALTNRLVGTVALPPGLDGRGALQLTLAGPWQQLHAAVRLEARPLLYPPLRLDRAVIAASIAGGSVRIREGSYLLGRGGGRVEGRISWAGVPEDRQVDLELTGSRLPLEDIGRQLGYAEAKGLLSFAGGLHGPLEAPHGSWAVGLVGVGAGPIPLGDGSAALTLENGTFTLSGLTLGEGVRGEAAWRTLERTVQGDVTWESLPTAPLGAIAVRMLGPTVAGRLAFTWPLDREIQGKLHLRSPQSRLDAAFDSASIRGRLQLLELGAADLDLQRGAGGGLRGTAAVEISSLAELNRRLLAARGEAFDGSAHAALAIVLPKGGEPVIDGVVDRIHLVMGDTTGGLVRPARFHVAGRSFSTPGLWIKTARGDELFARLTLHPDGRLSGNVSGTANARLFRLVAPQWESYGNIQLVGELSGSLTSPRFDGIAEIQDGSFRIPESSIVFSSLNGTLILSPEGIHVDGSTFRVLGGAGRAAGWIRITGPGPDFDLSGTIARARLEILPGLSPRLQGDWWLRGAGSGLTLGGDLTIGRTLLRRRDELSSILLDWFAKPRRAVTATLPNLDIRVEGDRAIDARNAFLRFQTSVFLHVTGTPAQPGLVGKIELSEGGEFTFQGVRYDIDSGLITFSDPTRIAPTLDMRLRARVDVYEIWVNLSGSGDRVIPTLSSDPPLSQEEIVALLATGHRTSESSSSSGTNLASSILSSSLGEVLDQRARSLLAVDQVRIDPFSESDAGSPTARVTLVKQLTPSWTIAVESNLASNREEVFFSRWILAPQVYLEVTRQRDGSWATDLRLRKRY